MQDGGGCGRDWNDCWYPKLAHMDNSSKRSERDSENIIGLHPGTHELEFDRRLHGLEEGEEAVRDADKMKDFTVIPP